MTITTAQKEGLRVLELGLDRIEAYYDDSTNNTLLDSIYDVGISMMPQKRKNNLGWYRPSSRLINVNYTHKRFDDIEEFNDTVLHELAHHLVYCTYGGKNEGIKPHGTEFKWACDVVGARPVAVQKSSYKETMDIVGDVPTEIIEMVWVAQKDISGDEYNDIGTKYTLVQKETAISKGWEHK